MTTLLFLIFGFVIGFIIGLPIFMSMTMRSKSELEAKITPENAAEIADKIDQMKSKL